MFAKPIAEQSLGELRKSEKQIVQWLQVEANEAKRQKLRQQLDDVVQALKRRKRR
jgi:hypothetical protein